MVVFLALAAYGPARAEVLTADTVWQGQVHLTDDLLVPTGITLTVQPGTVITVSPAESTKIDPEFLSHQTEILVRGTLKVLGRPETPALFTAEKSNDDDSRWAGIIVDGGGTADLQSARISGAETGLYLFSGRATLTAVTLEENHYGAIAHGSGAQLTLKDSAVRQNDFGLYTFNDAKVQEEGGRPRQPQKRPFHRPGKKGPPYPPGTDPAGHRDHLVLYQ